METSLQLRYTAEVKAQQLTRTALHLEGFKVLEARDGFEGLAPLEQYLPPLVILDLALPRVPGSTVREEIAAGAEMRIIPVLMVTASTEPLDRLEVSCILRQPVSVDRLIAAIRDCLAAAR